MNANQVVIKRIIKAPREKVFEAFTNPEIMSKWFYPDKDWKVEVTNDLKEGRSYTIKLYSPDGTMHTHLGYYQQIVPPMKLSFTWNTDFVRGTVVSIEFDEIGEDTEITLTHDFLPTNELFDDHQTGWKGCLENLEKTIE